MPAPSTGTDWTDQTIAILRTLWSEGHSTAEIGRRLDTTKNAIVGKAHRLQLSAQPSPIRDTPRTCAKALPCAKPSDPVPASSMPSRPVAPPPAVPRPVVPTPAPDLPALSIPMPVPQPPPARPAAPVPSRPVDGCQWPIGEPGKPGFHLCGDEPAPGKPYCFGHCSRAYVRMRGGASASIAL